MKRYLVFGYDRYYPNGGLSDLLGESDNLQDMMDLAKDSTFDMVEVFDQEIDDIVWNN